jgi:hypothetical protein
MTEKDEVKVPPDRDRTDRAVARRIRRWFERLGFYARNCESRSGVWVELNLRRGVWERLGVPFRDWAVRNGMDRFIRAPLKGTDRFVRVQFIPNAESGFLDVKWQAVEESNYSTWSIDGPYLVGYSVNSKLRLTIPEFWELYKEARTWAGDRGPAPGRED